MSINDLNGDSEFPESENNGKDNKKKKNQFPRPKKITSKNEKSLGESPFKKNYKFPVTLTFDRYFPYGQREINRSKTIYASNHMELISILMDDFTPLFLDGKHTRLFHEGISGFKDTLFSLDPIAYKLLLYILYSMQYGKEYVLINRQHLIDIKKYFNKNSFYKARNELIEANIISKAKVEDYYWLNAQFFFVGNRSSYFPEYVTSKEGDLTALKELFKENNKMIIQKRLKRKDLEE